MAVKIASANPGPKRPVNCTTYGSPHGLAIVELSFTCKKSGETVTLQLSTCHLRDYNPSVHNPNYVAQPKHHGPTRVTAYERLLGLLDSMEPNTSCELPEAITAKVKLHSYAASATNTTQKTVERVLPSIKAPAQIGKVDLVRPTKPTAPEAPAPQVESGPDKSTSVTSGPSHRVEILRGKLSLERVEKVLGKDKDSTLVIDMRGSTKSPITAKVIADGGYRLVTPNALAHTSIEGVKEIVYLCSSANQAAASESLVDSLKEPVETPQEIEKPTAEVPSEPEAPAQEPTIQKEVAPLYLGYRLTDRPYLDGFLTASGLDDAAFVYCGTNTAAAAKSKRSTINLADYQPGKDPRQKVFIMERASLHGFMESPIFTTNAPTSLGPRLDDFIYSAVAAEAKETVKEDVKEAAPLPVMKVIKNPGKVRENAPVTQDNPEAPWPRIPGFDGVPLDKDNMFEMMEHNNELERRRAASQKEVKKESPAQPNTATVPVPGATKNTGSEGKKTVTVGKVRLT